MAISIPMDAWSRVRPRIAQWEATTGRKITPAALRSMMEAEINVASDKAIQMQSLQQQKDQFQQQLDLQKEQAKKESAAAMVGGVANLGVAGAQLYLTNKYLSTLPKAIPTGMAPAISAELAGTEVIDAAGITTKGFGGVAGATAAAPTIGPATGITAAGIGSVAAPAAIAAEAGGVVFGGKHGLIGKGEKTQAWGRVGSATTAGAAIGSGVPGIGTAIGGAIGFTVGVIDTFIHGDLGKLFG